MRAGELTERITLLRPIVSVSDTGAVTESLNEVGSYRCRVKFGRGFRSAINNGIFYGQSVFFAMRYAVQVSSTDIIVFHGEKYRIIAIQYIRADDMVDVTCEKMDD